MTKLQLPNGILLEEIEEGLLVQQGTEAYVARNWCLSAPVRARATESHRLDRGSTGLWLAHHNPGIFLFVRSAQHP